MKTITPTACLCIAAGVLLLAAGVAEARDRNREGDRNGGMSVKTETRVHDRRDRQPAGAPQAPRRPWTRPIFVPTEKRPNESVTVVTRPQKEVITRPGQKPYTVIHGYRPTNPVVRPAPSRQPQTKPATCKINPQGMRICP